MQWLKTLFNFYINANIHVAFAGFCLTKLTLIEQKFYSNQFPFLVALLIIISYNFIRFYEVKENKLIWLKKWFTYYNHYVFFISILAILLLPYLFVCYQISFKTLLLSLPFVFVTFFYIVPVYKTKKIEFSFRNFPFVKIFSISLVWVGVTYFLPLFENGFQLDNEKIIRGFQQFLFVFIITLPFDIRDLFEDSEELKTIPQIIGIQNTKLIGSIAAILFVALEFDKQLIRFDIVFTGILSVLLLVNSSPIKSRYYTSFWVEAIPIFWLILYFLIYEFRF